MNFLFSHELKNIEQEILISRQVCYQSRSWNVWYSQRSNSHVSFFTSLLYFLSLSFKSYHFRSTRYDRSCKTPISLEKNMILVLMGTQNEHTFFSDSGALQTTYSKPPIYRSSSYLKSQFTAAISFPPNNKGLNIHNVSTKPNKTPIYRGCFFYPKLRGKSGFYCTVYSSVLGITEDEVKDLVPSQISQLLFTQNQIAALKLSNNQVGVAASNL